MSIHWPIRHLGRVKNTHSHSMQIASYSIQVIFNNQIKKQVDQVLSQLRKKERGYWGTYPRVMNIFWN